MNIKKISTLILCLSSFSVAQVESAPTIEVPEVVLTSVPFEVSVSGFDQQQACKHQLKINDFFFEPTVCSSNELNFEYLLIEATSDNQLELLLDQKKIASEESHHKEYSKLYASESLKTYLELNYIKKHGSEGRELLKKDLEESRKINTKPEKDKNVKPKQIKKINEKEDSFDRFLHAISCI